jgi:hypothetical protein
MKGEAKSFLGILRPPEEPFSPVHAHVAMDFPGADELRLRRIPERILDTGFLEFLQGKASGPRIGGMLS